MADASAGVSYTFVVTLAILYFMKAVVYVFRRYFTHEHTSWWDTTGYDEQYLLEDRLQATEQQRWPETTYHEPDPIIPDSLVTQEPLPPAPGPPASVPLASAS
jgi:hypothetical protein